MSKQLLNTPSTHPFSLAALADSAWNRTRDAAVALTAWTPLVRLAESAVTGVLQNITVGELKILTPTRLYTFPVTPSANQRPGPKGELRVVSDAFWIRLCTMGDLGFSEAYMYGEVQCDDLIQLFNVFLANKDNLSNLDSRLSYLFTIPQKLTSYRFLNSLSNSRSNISAHYDISNDMFAAFMSADMTYSCAIYEDLDSDVEDGHLLYDFRGTHGRQIEQPYLKDSTPPRRVSDNGDDLHAAQMRKLRHILQKAHIEPGHRVLEIGSGWGSMAILIAQSVPGTTIDTLTLSVQQQTLARKRIAAAGLSNRITVHLMDYRAMPEEWEHSFDRFISIEMIEAVGKEFLQRYWEIVDWALKKESGVGVVQVITLPEARFDRYVTEVDFIQKWIFPGAFIPSLTFLVDTLQKGSAGRLVVDSISNIGPHYARTLREWRIRFLDRFESDIVPSLRAEYPDVMSGPAGREEIEVFKRKWIYYYCYCEAGFGTRTLGDHIMTFAREGYTEYGCEVYN